MIPRSPWRGGEGSGGGAGGGRADPRALVLRMQHRAEVQAAWRAAMAQHPGGLMSWRGARLALGLSPSRFRQLVASGRIGPEVVVGGERYIPADSLLRAPSGIEQGRPSVDGWPPERLGGPKKKIHPLGADPGTVPVRTNDAKP